MAQIDQLAPDQRAALMLIVQQGQTYEDLAELLSTGVDAVRARAHSALALLGPDLGARLDPLHQAEVADYLLGQQSFSRRSATRELLAGSPVARAWARSVADELQPLTREPLPEIPAVAETEAAGAPAAPTAPRSIEPPIEHRPAAPAEPARPPPSEAASARETVVATAAAPAGWAPAPKPARPSSTRLGGLILILLAGAAIVVGILLLVNSNGGSKSNAGSTSSVANTGTAPTTATSGTSGTSGASGASGVRVVATLPLTATAGNHAQAAAEIVQQQGSNARALLVAGTGFARSTSTSAYAVWLYNSPTDALSLGFFSQQGTNGQLEGTAPLPANASHFGGLVITRETHANPKRPGTILLQGPFHVPA